MLRAPFFRYLEGAGISFGLSRELIDFITKKTRLGIGCAELLDDPVLSTAGVGPTHLLRIRRAYRRYQAQEEPAAERWAERHAPEGERTPALTNAFAAMVSATLKRGRLRFRARRPGDPRMQELAALAEHTEGCDEIPAHRWYAADRGVRDGLLWVEVVPPEGEAERSLYKEATPELIDDLNRSVAKPVLLAIADRSERRAIQTAADALHSLLSRPPVAAPVAGAVSDGQRTWTHALGGDLDGESADFGFRDLDGLHAWLNDREIEHVGVTRISGRGSMAEIIWRLSNAGLSVEPVREAGLMKQAKQIGGPIKPAAAEVTARRLRDPLEGYRGLDADELGLGEYLDQVNADRLRGALADVRAVAEWERKHAKKPAPVARGMGAGPMVKQLSDLRPGMQLTGLVANLTDFGAFVELGLSTQGLIHLSELSERFVEHPGEVVQVGDRVRVRVIAVDTKKQRISLTLREDREATRRGPSDKRVKAIRDLDKLFEK
jgi:predicted RNA-binding protein with RPS1 domain